MNIEELKKKLDEYSDRYYNEGNSGIEDHEFDSLVKEYETLTGEKYQSETAPRKGKKLVDVSHKFPTLVGTLDKAFNTDELFEWYNDLDTVHKSEIIITPKYDGNSVVVAFNNKGKVTQALTRGKEGKGLDLTDFFSNVSITLDSPLIKDLKDEEEIGIKCEALITYKNFDKISELEGKSYANPRNLVAGILNSLDGKKYAEYVSLAPIDYLIYNNETKTPYEDTDRLDRIKRLKKAVRNKELSNSIMLAFIYENKFTKEKMDDVYDVYISNRSGLDVMIDGLVIELVNEASRTKLGRSGDRNNYDIALKFPYMTAKTVVEDILWYVGKTGRFTPVAVVKPVYFNGAEITNISIANLDRFNKLKLYKNCPVIVGYRADVMAYLDVIEDEYDNIPENERSYYVAPTVCPSCKTKLETNETGTFLFCPNVNCKCNVTGKIVNWFTKLDIKGIKESTVEKLVEYMDEKYNDPSILRLYKLSQDELLNIEGFKEKTAENIYNAIHSKKEIYDYQLFGSLLFKNLGIRTSRDIFSKYTYDDINKENLLEVDGVSDVLADNFIEGIETNKEIIDTFMNDNPYIKVSSYKQLLSESSNGKDIPKVIVFTGFRDKDLQSEIEKLGSKVTSSVSKNTNVVVTKDINGSSSKLKKARELNIEIMTPEDFKNKYIL